ncbi:alpha/beta hydrolase family protein [Longispora albida]|uniref:alpha/beta hydrolase family protein n=1 Tax=Longispora albida TaxID=203523 RepID=UPI0003752A9A|nr:alpha/beta fold hydrolase [Longispora albida]
MQQIHLTHDGQQLGVHVYPDAAEDSPVVVFLPAMGVPAGYYKPWAAALRAEGLTPIIPDLRGTGSSRPRPARGTEHGLDELVSDVGTVLAALRPRLEGRKVLLAGHSLGGQLASLHLSRDPSGIDGLLLLATGVPYYRIYRHRRLGVLAFSQGIYAGARLIGYWPGWIFAGRQSKNVIRDWAYTSRHGRFPMPGAEDALTTVDLPVLAVSVAGDQFTPSVTLDHLVGKLTSARVTRSHYRAPERVDHFTWVRAAGPLAAEVAAFVHTL